MDEKVKIWIQKQRDGGKTDDEIRAGLAKSNWPQDKIDKLVPPKAKPKAKSKINRLYVIGGSVILVAGLIAVVVISFLSPTSQVFTFEECLENEIPESACSTLESLLNKEDLENWVSPQTLAVLGGDSTISDVLPDNLDVSIDVSTWLKSEVDGGGSATICAHADTKDYLVLLTNNDADWKVEITLELDENGTNPLFGDTSYCNDA